MTMLRMTHVPTRRLAAGYAEAYEARLAGVEAEVVGAATRLVETARWCWFVVFAGTVRAGRAPDLDCCTAAIDAALNEIAEESAAHARAR